MSAPTRASPAGRAPPFLARRAGRPSPRGSSSFSPLLATASSTPPSSSSDPPRPVSVRKRRQTLRFADARTGVDVVLVGTMHYNPASIELASSTVATLGASDDLAAIVLETCPSRWAKTLQFQPPGSLARRVLDNEFQAAAEAAPPDVPLVLGDQRIEDLKESAKETFARTWDDFAAPTSGGWVRIWRDARRGYRREVAGGAVAGRGLAFSDLANDPELASGMPLSLLRYPLAWGVKSPKVFVPFFAFCCGIAAIPGLVPAGAVDPDTAKYVASGAENAVSVLFLCLDVLEVVFLTRLFLEALLRRRNDILARSVRRACEEEAEKRAARAGGAGDGAGGGRARAVVAVLGAAHLNGVLARLAGEDGDEAWENAEARENAEA